MIGTAPSFRRRLLEWFDAHRRDLPWRRPPSAASPTSPPVKLDPYAVLVSEAMLQQTQVATVIPYFVRWMARFPTAALLAAADEQEVLKLWEGLGYYSRARNLHKAARAITHDHAGVFPSTVDAIRSLPGVGPYTAGAVASIAFDIPTGLVDGNVVRVLSRLHGRRDDPRTPASQAWLWATAHALVPKDRPGDFNSAVMELGATVCTPKAPQCLICPVARHCVAREQGTVALIPPPKKAKPTPHFHRTIYALRRPDGRYLLEQRPPKGRWAGMWQFLTRDPESPLTTPPPKTFTDLGEVEHALTHRRYTYLVRYANIPANFPPPPPSTITTAWASLEELSAYPLPKPHVRAAELLRGLEAR